MGRVPDAGRIFEPLALWLCALLSWFLAGIIGGVIGAFIGLSFRALFS